MYIQAFSFDLDLEKPESLHLVLPLPIPINALPLFVTQTNNCTPFVHIFDIISSFAAEL